MNMKDEIQWNSSMMQDGVILGTMEYMYKKGHTLQEANYVLFDDTDNSYAPILKAMSSVNQTHPDILLKEMITKNPQAQQLQQQQRPQGQALAGAGGATQFGGNAPRGMIMDQSQNYRATSAGDMRREGRANRAEIKQQRKTQRLQERAEAGKPITAGEYASAAGAKAKEMGGRALDAAGRSIAAGARGAREKGRQALGAAKDFFSGRMGREADGSAKEGFRARMSRLAQGIKNTPKAIVEGTTSRRGRISNEGLRTDQDEEIRRYKDSMHSGGTQAQKDELKELEAKRAETQAKIDDPRAKMSLRRRIRDIGERGTSLPLQEEEAPPMTEEAPPMTEEAPPMTEEAPPMTEEAPADTPPPMEGPTTAKPETASPIPTPVEAVEGGASAPAVEAAATDTAMPEEDLYANFSGDEAFGGAKTTRGKTSRALVDAMRGYEGKDFGELEEAVRGVPTKSGGRRRLTPYHRRMMEQHAKRRGFGPDMDDDSPPPMEAPKAPKPPKADEPPPMEEEEEVKARPLVAFSEDPMSSAWNALMILKHR